MIVFGRAPRSGHAKTRLAPAIGFAGAARLYGAFLDDTIRGVGRAIAGAGRPLADLELWIPPADPAGPLQERYPDVRVRRQAGGDLGERMRDAFERTFRAGLDYVVLLGSDHPTLPPDIVPRALRALRGAHLVLGPSEDGGYYAIGLRRYAWPAAEALFDGVPWSTGSVLDATRSRARAADLCHVELPTWYDIDRPADLARLDQDSDPDSRSARVWNEVRPERQAGP